MNSKLIRSVGQVVFLHQTKEASDAFRRASDALFSSLKRNIPMRLTTPIIETERLLLREITPVIIDILLHQFSRAELQAYLDIETEEALNNEIRKLSSAIETQRFSFKIWYLVEKKSKRVIGDVAYHLWLVLHQRAEIGYALRKEEDKRKGYMSEAVAAVLQHGFEEMKLQRIEACVSPINTASLQLVRKFGFQQEGYLRHHYHNRATHQVDDSLMFALLRVCRRNLKIAKGERHRRHPWAGSSTIQ